MSLSVYPFYIASTLFLSITILERGKRDERLATLSDDDWVKKKIAESFSGFPVVSYLGNVTTTSIDIGEGLQWTTFQGKIEGQRRVLNKWGIEEKYRPEKLIESSDIRKVRTNFTGLEGKYAEHYYRNIFKLIPENIRPERRRTYHAYDGTNNIFNLGYEMLKWKVHKAIINTKLEPYLGYLHSAQFAKPSLVCDFQELYRFIIDDYLIKYCQRVKKKDFITKIEEIPNNKTIKRQYLNDYKTDELMNEIDELFNKQFEIPRIRNGQKQAFETLINEESQLFAKCLRGEAKSWVPRVPLI